MDGLDADMMDTEAPAAASPRRLPHPSLPSPFLQPNAEQSEVVRGLLTMARQLIDQGKPSQALQAVVMATRTKGGDEAVIHSLNRARELYRNKIQASTDADELASLFAECAIAEADPLPSNSEPSQSNAVSQQPMEPDTRGTSILAETGRKQIMLDVFSDGSSFVCLQCGGLVGCMIGLCTQLHIDCLYLQLFLFHPFRLNIFVAVCQNLNVMHWRKVD